MTFTGKRVYDHGQADLYRYPQNNGDYWKESGYYYPQIDGQPIYVPVVEQSPSQMNEYLDDYYRKFTQSYQHATPAPYGYNSDSNYNQAESNYPVKSTLDESDDSHRGNYHMLQTEYGQYRDSNMNHGISEASQNLYYPETPDKANINKDYNIPEDKPKYEIDLSYNGYAKPAEHDYKDEPVKQGEKDYSEQHKPDYANYESSAIHGNIKPDSENTIYDEKISPPKAKPGIVYDYDLPVVQKTKKQKVSVKQKPHPGKPKSHSTYSGSEKSQKTKKSKGKRKKQPQIIKKYGYVEDSVPAVDSESTFSIKATHESKNDNLKEVKKNTYEAEEYPNEKGVVKHKIKTPAKNKGKVPAKPELKEKPVKIKQKVVQPHPGYPKTEEKVVKPEGYEYPVEIKKVVSKPKGHPIKEKPMGSDKEYLVKPKEKVKPKPKKPPAKTKDKAVVKHKVKKPPLKTKVVEKPDLNEYPVEIKKKVTTKSGQNNYPDIIKATPEPDEKYPIGDKTVVKKPNKPPVKPKEKIVVKGNKNPEYNPQSTVEEDQRSITDDSSSSLKDEFSDMETFEDLAEQECDEDENEPDEPCNTEEQTLDSESIRRNTVENKDELENISKFFPNSDSLLGLSNLNSNILSMLFNPNAGPRELKRCLTRNNETGFCSYIQNCDVPNVAGSLEQLLNNACVMDDVFIGICCPEFPVETVKVQWEQAPSNSERTEDEFGHNAEGELIKTWCKGYEQSLTNLLTSFFLPDCGIRSKEATELQSWPWKVVFYFSKQFYLISEISEDLWGLGKSLGFFFFNIRTRTYKL